MRYEKMIDIFFSLKLYNVEKLPMNIKKCKTNKYKWIK